MTSPLAAGPAEVAAGYAGRWSIEVTNRDAKQALGGQGPQSWKGDGPARAAALSLWLHTTIWCWYLATDTAATSWRPRPWYPRKRTASFADALAALRRTLACGGNELQPCRPVHRSPRNPRASPGLIVYR